MKLLLLLALLSAPVLAEGEPLILFETENVSHKYLLSMSYQESKTCNISEVILCDALAIRLKGAVCQITMSNVCIYVTKLNHASPAYSTNHFVQYRGNCTDTTREFPRDTMLIFRNSLMRLSEAKLDGRREGGILHSEGDTLKQEMKRLGQKPPPDADIDR